MTAILTVLWTTGFVTQTLMQKTGWLRVVATVKLTWKDADAIFAKTGTGISRRATQRVARSALVTFLEQSTIKVVMYTTENARVSGTSPDVTAISVFLSTGDFLKNATVANLVIAILAVPTTITVMLLVASAPVENR